VTDQQQEPQDASGATGAVQNHANQLVDLAQDLANDVIDAGEGAIDVGLGAISKAIHALGDAVDKIRGAATGS
jgi:hypothetical protein